MWSRQRELDPAEARRSVTGGLWEGYVLLVFMRLERIAGIQACWKARLDVVWWLAA